MVKRNLWRGSLFRFPYRFLPDAIDTWLDKESEVVYIPLTNN
jgi:hypothetical protein